MKNNETFFSSLEKERSDEMEVAEKKNEKRKKKKKSTGCVSFIYKFFSN